MSSVFLALFAQFFAPALTLAIAYGAAKASARALEVPEFRLFRAGTPGTRWKRFGVRIASVTAAFAACFLLAFVAVRRLGENEPTLTVEVVSTGPAREAGVRDGDRVIAVDGKRHESWETFRADIHSSPETRTLTLERNGERLTLSVTPNRGRTIGVRSRHERRPLGAGEAAERAFAMCFSPFRYFKREPTSLSGPVGVLETVARETVDRVGSTLYVCALYAAYSWLAVAALHVLDALLLRFRGPN